MPFDLVVEFLWDTAVIIPDLRFAYPEARYVATGMIADRLHVVCFTQVEVGIRVISFRKANQREIARYVQKTIDQ